jgi:hypothetical protein
LLALALNCVTLLSGTFTPMPAPVKVATEPVAATAPVQSDVLKIFTWVGLPVPTVPCTLGVFWLAGEAGSVPVTVGAAGGDDPPHV